MSEEIDQIEDTGRFKTALEMFDKANAQDPNRYEATGDSLPAELFYARRLYDWVLKLNSQASEAVLLAARCQHIRRWEIPRNTYPEGKVGYYQWRERLKQFHAEQAREVLEACGYSEAVIERVEEIVTKTNLKSEPDVQIVEDALCLVFLQYQFDSFIQKHEDKKIVRIVGKTWEKMSDAAREEALKLTYSERGKRLIEEAISAS